SGVPVDADFVFDVRCLPNPHWIEELKPLTGRDRAVREYLARQPNVDELFEHIRAFLSDWLPRFEDTHRAYMTVAIGCTGGRHRSVYMAERLAEHFDAARTADVLIRHRDLRP
ncbi:MAG: RNase adaptor protein RapZ, partial [Gammaproteobacteria bacterium]|nr:RNase adaptor protein RapZ [Gammaproteobacteria bacterium]